MMDFRTSLPIIAFGILICGGLSGNAIAQTVTTQQVTQESIDGVVDEVKGQRLKVRAADGTTRWFTTSTPLSPSHVGLRVRATATPAGDTHRLSSVVFSN
jgi:hypothetical protein